MTEFAAACEAAIAQVDPRFRAHTRRQVRALIRSTDISDYAQLTRRFGECNKTQRATITWLLGRLGRRRAVPFLLHVLQTDRAGSVRAEAATSLSLLGGKVALRGLLRLAPKIDLESRKHVVRALAFLGEHDALDFLVSSFANEEEDVDVRAQCAEGVANLLCGADRRGRAWRRAVDALLPGLKNDHGEIRFWTSFALGQLQARVALPALRQLARSDTTRVNSMGWEVRKEAKDAIEHIQRGTGK